MNKILILTFKIFRRILMYLFKIRFKSVGSNVIFNPFDQIDYKNIMVGNDVYIGGGATFAASESQIIIKDKVMFGPNVTIMGGDHNYSVIGEYMFDVKHKNPNDDQPVSIMKDVWIGAGATILKGVTIGRGSIVAAGSLVNKNVENYSIVAGVPAKHIRYRFSQDEITKHENIIKSKS